MFGVRVFRIFVSSTFTDMTAERDALQSKVFAELQAYCAERGFGFQALDLRWGIGDEVSAGHRTMRVCLSEIARCQSVSPRPNFVVLLGERYGWRPLPEIVEASEFEAVCAKLPDPGMKLARACYARDDNAVPPVYALRSKAEAAVDWDDAQARLRPLLAQAAEAAGIGAPRLARYRTSATEQEIIEGALNPEHTEDHVFCFLRSVTGLPPGARAYRDLTPEGGSDAEATAMLAGLKGRLRDRLGDHVFEYETAWDGHAPETSYCDKLCADMLAALRSVIDAEIARLESLTHLDIERAAHAQFEVERAAGFVGRAGYLELIAAYLANSSRHPLCIYSEGGFGKSALMAVAAARGRDAHPGAAILTRYIGVTSASADLRSLLQDLSTEIARAYGAAEPVSSTLQELQQELPARLALATAGKPLIVFLDSLDQLGAEGRTTAFWLPSDLPENVRLVVTTRPGSQLADLRERLPQDNLVAVGPLTPDEGREVLGNWLSDAGRKLRDGQRTEVLRHFDRVGSPLYLRLAFEEARRWTSDLEDVQLGADVPAIASAVFDRLAVEHGHELVAHALGFLAAAYERLGLSEEELLAALAADDHTWAEFIAGARWQVPLRQLPVALWSRLYFDLAPYLSPRASEGAALMSFFHRELADVARRRYLDGSARHLHSVLADVMADLARGRHAREREWRGSAHALAELPYHLIGAERWDELHATLTDFNFLEQKACRVAAVSIKDPAGKESIIYNGVLSLIGDFEKALAVFPES
jgi:hypothetical protein